MELQETMPLNETIEKTKVFGKQILESMERKVFDWDEVNLWGTGESQKQYGEQQIGQEDANKIWNTVRTLKLSKMLKEFLAKSSTTGINGAAYLIPVKIRQIMAEYAAVRDVLADVSMVVLGPDEIGGATHDVLYTVGGSYKPKVVSSGSRSPNEEIKYGKVTLDFSPIWSINFGIGNDLIEDSQFSLIEQHVRMAGSEMGQKSTEAVLTVMATTTDGDGTLNPVTAGADTTTMANLGSAIAANECDQFVPDRFLSCDHVMFDAIMQDVTYTAYATEFHNAAYKLQDPGMFGLQWVRCNSASLWTEATHLPTNCISYVFSKDYSYISGRKRWLRLENYSDPINDLVGAVISARQDTKSLYNDSVAKLSES